MAIAAVGMMLAGCAAKKPVKVAAVAGTSPPPPIAAPASKPKVYLQNTRDVPPQPPIPPGALPELPPPGFAAALRPDQDSAPLPAHPAEPVTPKPNAKAEAVATPAPAASPPPHTAEPLYSTADRTRDHGELDARVRELRATVAQLSKKEMRGPAKGDLDRITAMITLAEGAMKRGDLRQADELLRRASTLARGLK